MSISTSPALSRSLKEDPRSTHFQGLRPIQVPKGYASRRPLRSIGGKGETGAPWEGIGENAFRPAVLSFRKCSTRQALLDTNLRRMVVERGFVLKITRPGHIRQAFLRQGRPKPDVAIKKTRV